jgi:hypothetical protein
MELETDDWLALQAARQAAEAHTAAARAIETWIGRVGAIPTAGEVAEYGALVAREEATHAERRDAFAVLGLTAESVER